MTENKQFEEITIEVIIKEIKNAHSECRKVENQGTKNFIKLGRLLLNLKKEVKRTTGGRWEKYLQQHVPTLSIRSAQKYMKIASKVGPDKYPVLAELGVVRLYSLAELCKDLSIPEFLEKNEIGLDVEGSLPVQIFKDRVTQLIKRLKSSRGDRDPIAQFAKSVRKIEKQSESIMDDKSLLLKMDISEVDKLEAALSKLRKQCESLSKISVIRDNQQLSGSGETKIGGEQKIKKA